MISLAVGTVSSVKSVGAGIQWLQVSDAGLTSAAFALTELVGEFSPGDRVLLNTTAVELELGSGGAHVVVCGLDGNGRSSVEKGKGHIMKLRYTPFQHACLSVEEQDSPHHEALKHSTGLDGMPVVVASVHSQLVPVCLGIRKTSPSAVIACVMTDAAALPAAFSGTLDFVRRNGLVRTVITAGNAFGGDLEAVNIFSALQAAKTVVEADVTVVAMGPGITGTGTYLGHMAMEQGQVVNAVAALGGEAVAVPRLSFADPRDRHKGVSHHTMNALTIAALATGTMPLPEMEAPKQNLIKSQVEPLLARGWRMPMLDAGFVISALQELPLKVTTMGRAPDEDPVFFMAAAAAGMYAAGVVEK